MNTTYNYCSTISCLSLTGVKGGLKVVGSCNLLRLSKEGTTLVALVFLLFDNG